MKKIVSLWMIIMLLWLTISMPMTAYASDVNDNRGMYEITDKLYADAYMLVSLDDDSFPVIAQKNKDKKKFPASLTKIVTAIVAILNVADLQAKTKVSKSAIAALSGTGAQVAGLQPGDELTIEQLLYLTMVHSACDACHVLGEYVAGNVPEFVKMMNNWAKSVGCVNTNFVNPDGLHDDNHYTTVADMELITLEALKNETFYKIACTQQYEYDGHTFIHTNFMLDRFHVSYYYPYAEGIKTGSTSEAGYCVITKAKKNGYNYLAIVMDAPIRKLKGYDTKCSFIDAGTMFDWAFDSLKYSTVVRANDVISEVPVENGKEADTLQLVAEKDITTLVPVALDASAVMVQPVAQPAQMEAPIMQGEQICQAKIIYGEKIIGEVNLVAASTIELSTFLKILNAVRSFFGRKSVLAVLLLMIVAVAFYLVVFMVKLRGDIKRSKEKRRRREALEEQVNREYQRKRDDFLPPPRR